MKQRIIKGVLFSLIVILCLLFSYLFCCIKIKLSTEYKEKVWKERIEELGKVPD